MTVEFEVNYFAKDFEVALKWYSMIKEPNKHDKEAYNKLKVLVDSMKYDEEQERLERE